MKKRCLGVLPMRNASRECNVGHPGLTAFSAGFSASGAAPAWRCVENDGVFRDPFWMALKKNKWVQGGPLLVTSGVIASVVVSRVITQYTHL